MSAFKGINAVELIAVSKQNRKYRASYFTESVAFIVHKGTLLFLMQTPLAQSIYVVVPEEYKIQWPVYKTNPVIKAVLNCGVKQKCSFSVHCED